MGVVAMHSEEPEHEKADQPATLRQLCVGGIDVAPFIDHAWGDGRERNKEPNTRSSRMARITLFFISLSFMNRRCRHMPASA